jgi:uncharacterized delta-60 repeat protein
MKCLLSFFNGNNARNAETSLRRVTLRSVAPIVKSLAALVLSASSICFAQYGTFDTTWGASSSGWVKTSILATSGDFSTSDYGRAVAIQIDGKAVVAGPCTQGGVTRLCIARYNTNGGLDTSFNGSGKASFTAVIDTTYQSTAIAITSLGQIVVVFACQGSTSGSRQFCAVAFSQIDGSVVTGFGTSGLLKTTLPATTNYPSAVAVQASGKLVIAGLCGSALCAVRYDDFGTTLDPTFGTSGIATNPLTGTFNRETFTMALDAGDKILLAGSCSVSSQTRYCITRFTSNGTVDASFGSGGSVSVDAVAGGQDYAYAMAVQADGKILLTGQAFNTISSSTVFDYATVRYNANGSLDTGFGSGGAVITRVANSYSEARAIVVHDDGKIVVAGHCYDFSPSAHRFCLVGYHPDGSLDTTFNSTGIAKVGLVGNRDRAYTMAIGRDGKLYVAGQCSFASSATQFEFCIARFSGTPNGGLACNMDFDSDGNVRLTIESHVHARLTRGVYTTAPFSDFALLGGLGIPFFSFNDIWIPMHRKLLRTTLDIDGDGAETITDSIIHARIAAGMTASAVITGLTFASNATRTDWTAIRTYATTRCGLTLP